MKRSYKLIAVVLCLIIAIAASYNAFSYKQSWHVDEAATLGLANGRLGGYISAYDDSVYGRGAFLKSRVFGNSIADTVSNVKELFEGLADGTVSASSIRDEFKAAQKSGEPISKQGEEFASYLLAYEGFTPYDVYINQITDAHPPLYYMFINASYAVYNALGYKSVSFVPGWIVNMLFLCGSCLMLIRIGEKRFGSFVLGLAAAAFFALSDACITLGVYIRMYMMVGFFALWSLDAHLSVMQSGKITRGRAAALIASCALGFLTHYYFAVWALAMALWLMCVSIARHGMRMYVRYFLCMAAGVAVTLIVWPFSIVHLLFSNRGYTAIAGLGTLSEGTFIAGLKFFMARLLGNMPYPALALIVICAVTSIVKKRSGGAEALFVFVPACMYAVIIALIQPYVDTRYMACAYAPAALSAAWCVKGCIDGLKRVKAKQAISVAAMAALACSAYLSISPNFLFEYSGSVIDAVRSCSDMNAVYLTNGSSGFFRELPLLAEQKETVIVTMDELDVINDMESDSFLLYVNDSYSPTSALKTVEEQTGYVCAEIIAERDEGLDARVYVMTRKAK